MSLASDGLAALPELRAEQDVSAQLRAENAKLRAALDLIDNFAWSALTADCEEARVELNRRVQVCRDALNLPTRDQAEIKQ